MYVKVGDELHVEYPSLEKAPGDCKRFPGRRAAAAEAPGGALKKGPGRGKLKSSGRP